MFTPRILAFTCLVVSILYAMPLDYIWSSRLPKDAQYNNSSDVTELVSNLYPVL
jgi:hypothetical protein